MVDAFINAFISMGFGHSNKMSLKKISFMIKKAMIALGLMTLMYMPLQAQIIDTSDVESFDEILVSAQRFDQKRKDSPRQIEVLSSKRLIEMQPATLGDALINSGKVFVQKSQMGGSSPILRGFEASRVLMVVDGVRMNNATYRAGHLQDIITIDPFILDKMEVNFGSGSTLFGSDALGGVLYFKTKEATLGAKKISPYANVRYLSVNSGMVINGGVQIQLPKVGLILNATSSNFGDLQMGKNSYYDADPNFGLMPKYVTQINNKDTVVDNEDPYVQKGTGYKQLDLFGKLTFKTGLFLHTLNFQKSSSDLVPRYDRISENNNGVFVYGRWDYTPQNRDYLSYQLKFGNDNHSNRFTIAQQNTEVGRVTRNFGSITERTQLDKVKMNTINFDRHDVLGNLTLNSGIEYVINEVSSKGTNKKITDNSETTTKARYSDSGATTKSWSVFTQAIYNFKPTGTVIQGGLRITGYDLVAHFSTKNPWKLPYTSIQFSNVAPSFDLGMTQMVSDHLMIKGSLNQAFRNPNVDDMTKVFDSKKGVKLLVPNDQLQPEISITTDFGLAYTLPNKFMFETGLFNSNVSNLLLDQKGSWDGNDSMVYDGVNTPVYQVTNIAFANISGAYFNVKARLYKELWVNASATTTSGTYQKGKDSLAQPLDHIPPVFGQVSMRWNAKLWFVEAQILFNGQKDARDYSSSGEDNADKNPVIGNPAWQIFNLRGGFTHKSGLSVQFALENLLDLRYRYFASGVTAGGRSLSCTLSYKF